MRDKEKIESVNCHACQVQSILLACRNGNLLLSLIDNFRFIKNFTTIFIRKIVKYTDHLDLDSTVLSLDWGINKNNIVRMVNWDYMVSSKIAALLLNYKIRQVPFPYHRISKLLRLPT